MNNTTDQLPQKNSATHVEKSQNTLADKIETNNQRNLNGDVCEFENQCRFHVNVMNVAECDESVYTLYQTNCNCTFRIFKKY